ncbi:23S rRNA m(2)G2445 methyltransferase [Chitinispirillum alkaliphilum]|nr:23S rRNA m(2)G2445 methyltransferase [Chitinispirillum alkaliphilum]
MQKSSILITVPKGLCGFLRTEVESLGYAVRSVSSTSLETEGSRDDAMRLNLHIRTGHHVLFEIARFRCSNADELYEKVNSIPWETMLSADGYFSVVSNVVNPTIRDNRYVNVRCKDAVVDRINVRKGRRPDSGPDRSRAVISVFWREDRCRVYLDTSGESLSKRGYRKIPLTAPMQETLASGVVYASQCKDGEHFVNPMCGSGTISIEAALIKSGRVPGLTRSNFGFYHFLGFDMRSWDRMKQEARMSVRKNIDKKIIASDINEKAVDAAFRNASTAGVSNLIEFETGDLSQTTVPQSPGVIVVNPEYGIRMGEEARLAQSYRDIGNFFKRNCKGYRGYIFTANSKLAGQVGLKSKRKIVFYTGKVEARLYQYDLY